MNLNSKLSGEQISKFFSFCIMLLELINFINIISLVLGLRQKMLGAKKFVYKCLYGPSFAFFFLVPKT